MRKYILWTLICLLSIWFASADYITWKNQLYEFNINSPTELWNFTYQFDSRGNLATISSSSQWNFVFNAFANGQYTLWNSYGWYNWKLYYYSKSSYNWNTKQWYLNKWCIKENLSDCYNWNYVWDTEDVIATIWTISKVVYGANIELSPNPWWGNLAGANNPTMLCFYDGNYYCVSCSHSSDCQSWLTGTSLNINADNITTLNNIQREQSPFNTIPQQQTPETQWLCITVEELFEMQSNNYNTWLCYGNTRIKVNWWRQTTYPIRNLVEIYPTYSEFREDINTYYNYCKPPNTMETCQEAFSWKQYNYTIVSKLPDGTDPAILWDMCKTYQTRSGNMQKNICDMTEEEQKDLVTSIQTPEWQAEAIAKGRIKTTLPASWTVYDDLTDTTKRDIITAIPSVRTKISSIFVRRSGKTWIIPNYITWFLLLIVLFKLWKK